MDRRTYILINWQVRKRASDAVYAAPEGHHCIIQEPTRTLDQNAAQWPILEAFSRQLTIPVNGAMAHLDPEEWKDILTAIFKGEQLRFAQWFDGRTILLGHRTKEFKKKEFSDWIEFLRATAVERDVNLEKTHGTAT